MIDQDLLIEVWKMQSWGGIPAEVCYGTLKDQAEWLDQKLKAIIDILEKLNEKERTRRDAGWSLAQISETWDADKCAERTEHGHSRLYKGHSSRSNPGR